MFLAIISVGSWLFAVPGAASSAEVRVPAPSRIVAQRPPFPPTSPPASAPVAPPKASAATAPNVTPTPPAATNEAVAARTPALENTDNFLLIGLDRRPDGGGAALADTLIVAVLDRKSGHVGLVSIPRDLYVEFPDQPPDRINTAYTVARRTGQNPLELLARVVEDTLKLPIEHALAIDLGVFERAVDALSGVTVDVPCAISDRFLDSRVPGGKRVLDVEPGQQRMDGATAAMYARSRHGRSDFSRARRQQAVLLGMRRELTGIGGMARVPALWTEFESSIETTFRRVDILRLARRALATRPEHLHGLVLGPPRVRGFRTDDGRAVLLAEPAEIDAALADLFSQPSPGIRPQEARCEPKDAALGRATPYAAPSARPE